LKELEWLLGLTAVGDLSKRISEAAYTTVAPIVSCLYIATVESVEMIPSMR